MADVLTAAQVSFNQILVALRIYVRNGVADDDALKNIAKAIQAGSITNTTYTGS